MNVLRLSEEELGRIKARIAGPVVNHAAPIDPPKKRKRVEATTEHQLLRRQLIQAGIAFQEEFRFHHKRRWRFDFLVGKFGIEIDGGIWVRGRHSRGKGQIADMEKANAAAMLGYFMLRFTPQQVKQELAITTIQRAVLPE